MTKKPKIDQSKAPDSAVKATAGTAHAEPKQIPGRFQKGRSGNPKGKLKGCRNRATMAVQELLRGEAEKITRRCIEAALGGDMTALKLILERVCPPMKDAPVELPASKTPANTARAAMNAMTSGRISPSTAEKVLTVIEKTVCVTDLVALAERVERLEKTIEKGPVR